MELNFLLLIFTVKNISPAYIRFAFGDHLMRKVTIGDPDFGPSYVPEGKLFDSDFELAEVKTAVVEVWAKYKTAMESAGFDDHILGLYSLIKDKAKHAGLAAKAKLKNSKLAWRRKVTKKLEVFERFAKEGRLNRYRLAHLQVAQRDILELEADDLAAEAYKGKMLSIQFDGKSTRHFFKPPKKVKKCIKSMGNSVDSLLMILEMKLLLSSTDFGKTAKG